MVFRLSAIVAPLLLVGCAVPLEEEELGAALASRLEKHQDVGNADYVDQAYTVHEIWDVYQANEARGNADFLDHYVVVQPSVDFQENQET